MIEESLTPLQKYEERVQKINELHKEGHLTDSEWTAALKKAKNEYDGLEDAAKKLLEETRTPQEKYAERLKTLDELWKAGSISADTYNRAVRQAREELEDGGWKEAAQDFSRVIGTAFEDAAVKGQGFQAMLQGLAEDMQLIMVRVLVTKPLETAFTKMVVGAGTWLPEWLGGTPAPAAKQTGGMISGPGGPRDDLVPILASNGEFVVNARATQMFLPLIAALNEAGLRCYQGGGAVGEASLFSDPPPPRYAWGATSALQARFATTLAKLGVLRPDWQEQLQRGVDIAGSFMGKIEKMPMLWSDMPYGINPTVAELKRIAKADPSKEVRYARDTGTGDLVVWPASELIHANMAKMLGTEFYAGYGTLSKQAAQVATPNQINQAIDLAEELFRRPTVTSADVQALAQERFGESLKTQGRDLLQMVQDQMYGRIEQLARYDLMRTLPADYRDRLALVKRAATGYTRGGAVGLPRFALGGVFGSPTMRQIDAILTSLGGSFIPGMMANTAGTGLI